MTTINQEQFNQYLRVQQSGMFNMFDPQARMMTDLTRDEWVAIMDDYGNLYEKYATDSDDE